MKKLLITLILILLSVSLVNAITGSIGNAKMILRVDKEDIPSTLEKYILVKNVNNVSINIRLEPTEEIKDIVKIYDEEFNLEPKEEKKARFDLKIKESGIYNGNINVFFTPLEGSKTGVALTSNIIVNAGESSKVETVEEVEENNSEGVSVSLGGTGNAVKKVDNEMHPLFIILITFGIIIIAVVVIFLILIKKVV